MKNIINLSLRRPIWIALSKFYLDTELQSYDFRHIAAVVKESPYTLADVKRINREEVFPALWTNLITVAGVWSGFDEEWLVKKIASMLKTPSKLKDFWSRITFLMFKKGFKSHWKAVETYLKDDKFDS